MMLCVVGRLHLVLQTWGSKATSTKTEIYKYRLDSNEAVSKK
jgi:hypothetical protein